MLVLSVVLELVDVDLAVEEDFDLDFLFFVVDISFVDKDDRKNSLMERPSVSRHGNQNVSSSGGGGVFALSTERSR